MPSPNLCDPVVYGMTHHSDVAIPGWTIGLIVLLLVLVWTICSVCFGRQRTGGER